jgi:hypothetical protein
MFHMKHNIIENWLLFTFAVVLTFQKRHIFFQHSPTYQGQYFDLLYISLFAVDLIVGLAIIYGLFKKFHVQQRPPTSTTWWNVSGETKLWMIIGVLTLLNILFVSRGGINKIYFALRVLELGAIGYYFTTLPRGGIKTSVFSLGIALGAVVQSFTAALQFLKQSSVGLWLLGEPFLYTSLDGIAKIDYDGSKILRAYGTFQHPNQLAAFLVLACGTSAYLYIEGHKNFISEKSRDLSRLVALIGMTSSIFGLFLTFSRAGILGLVTLLIGMVYHVVHVPRGRNIKIAVFAIILSILSSVSLLWPFINTRATISDSSTEARLSYNKIGLDLVKQHPFHGTGLGNTLHHMVKQINPAEIWQAQPPHNFFIALSADLGLPIFIIFAFIVLRYIYRLVTEKHWFVLSILISVLVMMQFDHYFFTLVQTQLLLACLLGFFHGLTSTNKKAAHY